MNLIFGAGGVAREVAWLVSSGADSLNRVDAFVVADRLWAPGESIDGIPVLSESQIADVIIGEVRAYLALGLPSVRRNVVAAIRLECSFPNFIDPLASMDRRPGKVVLGQGVLIYPLASLTTEISIGDFVLINPCATVGHGARIGNFCTLCPGANVSGNVTVGNGCFIGAGAVIKEGVRIADNCMVGAGAVVVSDITQSGTWVGVPARKIHN